MQLTPGKLNKYSPALSTTAMDGASLVLYLSGWLPSPACGCTAETLPDYLPPLMLHTRPRTV